MSTGDVRDMGRVRVAGHDHPNPYVPAGKVVEICYCNHPHTSCSAGCHPNPALWDRNPPR